MSTIVTVPPEGSTLPEVVIGENYSTNIFVEIENFEFIQNVVPTGLPDGLSVTVVGENNLNIAGISNGPAGTNNVTFELQIFNTENNTVRTEVIGDYTLPVVVVCISANSEILMADGTIKQIQDIQRGDLVAANLENTKHHRVARVLKSDTTDDAIIDVCIISKDSFKENVPSKDLTITFLHPVIFKKKRIHAFLLKNYDGVRLYSDSLIKDFFVADKNGKHALWDLQFETVGSYVANGLTIQSRHPQSFLTPLPKDLYFDQSLFSEEKKNDLDPAYELPLEFV